MCGKNIPEEEAVEKLLQLIKESEGNLQNTNHDITQIVRNAFTSRQKEIERYDNEAEALQMHTLEYLATTAKTPNTEGNTPSAP